MGIKLRLEKDYSVKLTFTCYNCMKGMTRVSRVITLEIKEHCVTASWVGNSNFTPKQPQKIKPHPRLPCIFFKTRR